MSYGDFHTARGYQLLERHKGGLTPSLADYLEMIYRSDSQGERVRINTLATQLNVKPSSVSKMVLKLTQLGFLDYKKYGIINLTEEGREKGAYLLSRHDIISRFFELLSGEQSESTFVEIELIEHILTEETVHQIDRLTSFFEENKALKSSLKQYINR